MPLSAAPFTTVSDVALTDLIKGWKDNLDVDVFVRQLTISPALLYPYTHVVGLPYEAFNNTSFNRAMDMTQVDALATLFSADLDGGTWEGDLSKNWGLVILREGLELMPTQYNPAEPLIQLEITDPRQLLGLSTEIVIGGHRIAGSERCYRQELVLAEEAKDPEVKKRHLLKAERLLRY